MPEGKDDEHYFEPPSTYQAEIGDARVQLKWPAPEGYEETFEAMKNLAGIRGINHRAYVAGKDDYWRSFRELMFVLDSFVANRRATNSLHELTSGHPDNFEPTSRDATIRLLLQLRNVATHSGGRVDPKAVSKYNNIWAKYDRDGIQPAFPLPRALKLGYRFRIGKELYLEIEDLVYGYMKEKVGTHIFGQLKRRGAIADIELKMDGTGR